MNQQSQLMTGQVDTVAQFPPNYNNDSTYTYVGTQGADQAVSLLKKYANGGEPQRPWGMVFNTDPIDKPGQHWIALYASDDEEKEIEIMDSYGSETFETYGSDVQELLKYVTINPKMPRLQGNTTFVC
jgi:hypothetical protein